jgi:hypothetical protein
MHNELIIPSAVSVIAIGLYVIALWIGDHRTISTLAGASNLALGLAVIALGLACTLGLPLNVELLANPNNWLQAVGRLVQHL